MLRTHKRFGRWNCEGPSTDVHETFRRWMILDSGCSMAASFPAPGWNLLVKSHLTVQFSTSGCDTQGLPEQSRRREGGDLSHHLFPASGTSRPAGQAISKGFTGCRGQFQSPVGSPGLQTQAAIEVSVSVISDRISAAVETPIHTHPHTSGSVAPRSS